MPPLPLCEDDDGYQMQGWEGQTVDYGVVTGDQRHSQWKQVRRAVWGLTTPFLLVKRQEVQ